METTNSKPSITFWVVSVLALLWNLMGVSQFILMASKSESVRVGLSAEKLALIDATPIWSTAAFGIAVFAAALGSLALLLRKKIAATLFIISFIAILVQNVDTFTRFNVSEFNGMELSMTLMIPLFGLFLIWYSKRAIAKGLLK